MNNDEARETSELIRGPLDGFTAARTARVRELRREGQREMAERLAGLRKPSLVLWVLNQAGVIAPDDLDALRAAADRLRRTQERVLQGDRSAVEDMQRALQEQRSTVDVLTRRLGMTLTAAGHAASEDALRRINDALRSASLTEDDTWDALQQGTLLTEPEGASFPLMVVPPPERAAAQHADREEQAHRKRIAAAEADLRRAEELERTTREHAELADQRHDEAIQALEAARAALTELEHLVPDAD